MTADCVMNWDQPLQLNDAFHWEPLPDGCMLYRRETGQIVTLNLVAELIFNLWESAGTPRTILEQLRETTPCDDATFQTTVERLLQETVLLPVP